ncbi:MAG: hypothetical protein AAFP90_19355, partial [Planctomycetota bacterium]
VKNAPMNGHESGFQMRHQPLQQGGFTRSVRPNNRQPAGAPAVIDPLAGRSIADVVDAARAKRCGTKGIRRGGQMDFSELNLTNKSPVAIVL